jgi:hypothetical protein
LFGGTKVICTGRIDITNILTARDRKSITVQLYRDAKQKHTAGQLNLNLRFRGAWEVDTPITVTGASLDAALLQKEQLAAAAVAANTLPPLHSAGVLRVFIVDAHGLREEESAQDPYVKIERLPITDGSSGAVVSSANSSVPDKPFTTAVKQDAGRDAVWLECCDVTITAAEAQAIRAASLTGTPYINLYCYAMYLQYNSAVCELKHCYEVIELQAFIMCKKFLCLRCHYTLYAYCTKTSATTSACERNTQC